MIESEAHETMTGRPSHVAKKVAQTSLTPKQESAFTRFKGQLSLEVSHQRKNLCDASCEVSGVSASVLGSGPEMARCRPVFEGLYESARNVCVVGRLFAQAIRD